MKCLGKSKLVQVLVWKSTSLVGEVRRLGMSILANTLVLLQISFLSTFRQQITFMKHRIISMKNLSLIRQFYILIIAHCSPFTYAPIFESDLAYARVVLSQRFIQITIVISTSFNHIFSPLSKLSYPFDDWDNEMIKAHWGEQQAYSYTFDKIR